MSSAARTNVVPGLVLLGSSPQWAGAHCCSLGSAFVLQALLSPYLLHREHWGCPMAGQQGTSLHMGQYFWSMTSSSSHHCSSNYNKHQFNGSLVFTYRCWAGPQLLWTLCVCFQAWTFCVCFQACSHCSTLRYWVCRKKHRAANNWNLTTAWLGLNSSTFIMSKNPQIPEYNQL